ncbi:hypothetical protein BRADI_1g23219v3 [Brachypodium distachyon]|uniref:Uncharacterized protein n=1 Tax=Brachypodium distachyon TaxID=15368 RepID=A0A2K2DKQ3_BRADI|nr:hypothetical protein BRADI_1g23219v3 [Brachypodium distachyon]
MAVLVILYPRFRTITTGKQYRPLEAWITSPRWIHREKRRDIYIALGGGGIDRRRRGAGIDRRRHGGCDDGIHQGRIQLAATRGSNGGGQDPAAVARRRRQTRSGGDGR